MKRKAAFQNLRQILGLIPLLHANPGMHLEEVRRLTGHPSTEALREDIQRLILLGLPPFSPSDFIDLYIDEEDRIYLEFPQGLERPLALTTEEWTAIQIVLERESSILKAGEKPASILQNLLGRFASIPVDYESSDATGSIRAIVEEALEERLQMEFRYRTIASKEPEIRQVDPWALFSHRGSSYVIAYCHMRGEPRYFHLERMEDPVILEAEQSSTPPENLDEMIRNSPIFKKRSEGFTVELAFAPDLLALLSETLPPGEPSDYRSSDRAFSDWKCVRFKIQEGIWLRSYLRALGPGAMILSPEHLRESYFSELQEVPIPAPLPD